MVTTIIVLALLAAVGASLLFVVSKKFEVIEDPRIAEVGDVLPQANCGGCGFPGCSAFAQACVKSDNLEGLFCPVGGSPVMERVSGILGMATTTAEPLIAVVRCNGTCEARPRTNIYDGTTNCRVAAALYKGDTDCSFGCLGHGDCVVACGFDAIHINKATLLPEVVEDKCVACGACVKACPKTIIELRKKGPKGRRIFVSCVNKDKGGAAMKACKSACIGCSKCEKECKFEAITIENNLSYIDHTKCRLCRKCVSVCPTNAIHELGFPPKKEVAPTEGKPVSVTATPKAQPTPAPKAETKAEAQPTAKAEDTTSASPTSEQPKAESQPTSNVEALAQPATTTDKVETPSAPTAESSATAPASASAPTATPQVPSEPTLRVTPRPRPEIKLPSRDEDPDAIAEGNA